MSPIVNLEHAIWHSPAAASCSARTGPGKRRAPSSCAAFSSELALARPAAVRSTRILFVTGEFDSIAPTAEIEAIHQTWRGSELLRVRQGHFGYRMMRETIAHLKQRGDL